MKDNKGVTLTSLIIYVIGMIAVIATIATITSFFYKNINIKEVNNITDTEYTKFSSIFINEINKPNNIVIDCKTLAENGHTDSYIIFSSGNQYTYKEENRSIYKNKIKICQNVEKCQFEYSFIDSKYNITVNFKTSNIDLTENNALVYTLKP